jgi:hypothetical protein
MNSNLMNSKRESYQKLDKLLKQEQMALLHRITGGFDLTEMLDTMVIDLEFPDPTPILIYEQSHHNL